jgi:tetratricopeptide (TPR) repeat protein
VNKPIRALSVIIATLPVVQSVSCAAGTPLSRAERSISEAQKAIDERPKDYEGYNLLATALIMRAHETFDTTLYSKAVEAVMKSLALSPDNFETEKIQASALLGEHDYPAALELARALKKRVPDDLTVYGLLADAEIALGDYKDAEESTNWMLNLRRGNRPAYISASRLREVFGDAEGASEMAELAFQSTIPSEVGERASLLTQLGRIHLTSGDTNGAEKLLQQALETLPNYPDALGSLAQLRIAQKRYGDAVLLCQQRYQLQPRAGNLYYLAEALQLAGRGREAQESFAAFEAKALTELTHKDNSNLELVFYYADHAYQPAKALGVAKREYAWRHDVSTLDAYAWALHANAQDGEARKQIETALEVGFRDAKLLRHAGEISLKMKDQAAAERYLKQSADLKSLDSESAQTLLLQLSGSDR